MLYTTPLAFERQHLTSPASEDEYYELLKYMAPVSTTYWIDPGSAPELQNRAAFDDLAFNDELRHERRLVKGRYRGGGVGYVLREDQELCAAAYMKPQDEMSLDEAMMLEFLQKEGPHSVAQIKKKTGLLVKHITPLLHKLASRFLVAEDQFENGWSTLWYPFERLYPDQDVRKYTKEQAIAELLRRQAYMFGKVTNDSARSLYGFTVKDIKLGANYLLDERVFVEERDADGDCLVLADDLDRLKTPTENPHCVIIFNRSDPLVRANEAFLKGRYTLSGSEVMYYVNVDGVFCGAVMGKFNFTGNEHRDLILELPYEEAQERREEILGALYKIINPLTSPLLGFMGEEIMF